LPPAEFLRECATRFVDGEPIRRTGRQIFQTRRRIERAFAEHEIWRHALRKAEEQYLAARGWTPIQSADRAWYGVAWVVETLAQSRPRDAVAYVEEALAAESPEELNDVGWRLFSMECPACGVRVLKTWGACELCGAALNRDGST